MRFMEDRKNIKKITVTFTGLIGVCAILMTTGCEVQKVGSTPSKDYIIDPFPGPPVPTDFEEDTTGNLDSTVIEEPPEIPDPDLPDAPAVPDPDVPDAPTADSTAIPEQPEINVPETPDLPEAPAVPDLPDVPPPPDATDRKSVV